MVIIQSDGNVNWLDCGIISQCIHISKHQVAYLNYMKFLFVNNTFLKLEEEKKQF